MLPVVVTAGLLIAIGNLTGGGVIEDYKAAYSVPDALVSLGVLGMGLLAPVIAGPSRIQLLTVRVLDLVCLWG